MLCGGECVSSCWRTFLIAGWRLWSLDWYKQLVGEYLCVCLSRGKSINCKLIFAIFDSPETLSRIMGNVVLKNLKARFVITHKLLLLQYHHKVST